MASILFTLESGSTTPIDDERLTDSFVTQYREDLESGRGLLFSFGDNKWEVWLHSLEHHSITVLNVHTGVQKVYPFQIPFRFEDQK